MAIFAKLKLENILQVNDKTRLDGTDTFISPDEAAISLLRIDPGDGSGFLDVTSTKYLDWQYANDNSGTPYTVQIEVTTDGAPITTTKDIPVISVLDDRLFSNDNELESHEPGVLRYTRSGRSSFIDVHRVAQEFIIDYLDKNKVHDKDGNRLGKANIIVLEEINLWSRFTTLKVIFQGLSNAIDDIFAQKASDYAKKAAFSRDRSILRLDRDNDGLEDDLPTGIRPSFVRRI